MNYEEQRMAFWAARFDDAQDGRDKAEAAKYADDCLAEFDKRFGSKTEPLPELTK